MQLKLGVKHMFLVTFTHVFKLSIVHARFCSYGKNPGALQFASLQRVRVQSTELD